MFSGVTLLAGDLAMLLLQRANGKNFLGKF